MIGGMPNTQRVIDFCHQHNIVPKIKLITAKELDNTYEELSKKNDSILRYVINLTQQTPRGGFYIFLFSQECSGH